MAIQMKVLEDKVKQSTVPNNVQTVLHALHERLFAGVVSEKILSQLKCKGSFLLHSKFVSARVAMDATESTQYVSSDLTS